MSGSSAVDPGWTPRAASLSFPDLTGIGARKAEADAGGIPVSCRCGREYRATGAPGARRQRQPAEMAKRAEPRY